MSVAPLDKQDITPNLGLRYDHFEHAIEISIKISHVVNWQNGFI